MISSRVLHDIGEEREQQDKEWGAVDHPFEVWVALLGEEFGEVCQEVITARIEGIGPYAKECYREELVQLAALAVAALESFDRQHRGKK